MRDMGLRGASRGKPVRTTISDKAAPCPLDRVNRQFHASAPDRLWLADFTYVATWTGFVYVALVIDAYARRIVGWRASRTAHADLSWMPWNRRFMTEGPPISVASSTIAIGPPICSIKYTERLAEAGIEPSVGSVGDFTTTRWLKRSMASTRPRSFTDEGRGATSRLSSSQPSSGWTGSTIAGFWSPSASSRRPKPRNATSP